MPLRFFALCTLLLFAGSVTAQERLGGRVHDGHEATASPLVDVIQDGGFEAGSPNPFWDEASTNFGTPLCTTALCGFGGGTGPHSGSWWVWFGGISGASETGSVSQDVTLVDGTATLSFWLEIPVADASGFMSVQVDGTEVFRVTEADQATYATYAEVTVDISDFADGGTHTLLFTSTTDAGAGALNFFVDDVMLDNIGTAIEANPDGTPGTHALTAVYPNPSVGQARFALEVAEPQAVRVEVYNVLGQRVATLHDGTLAPGAEHRFTLDGADLAGGVYVVRVTGETFSDVRTVTLAR